MTDAALVNRMQLPRPDVGPEEAAAILREHYRLSGPLHELGSQQDRNYRVDADDARYVIKICRAEYAAVELEAQNAAIRHLRAKADAPRVPGVVAVDRRSGYRAVRVRDQDYQVRVLEYLDGQSLTRPEASADCYRCSARCALRSACARSCRLQSSRPRPQPSMGSAPGRTGCRAPSLGDHQPRGARPYRQGDGSGGQAHPAAGAAALRVQAVHHDVTDDNVVSRPDAHGHPLPDGVIDFGDIIHGWLVGDLAVTCASLLHHAGGDPFCILPAVKAYHAIYPLNEAGAEGALAADRRARGHPVGQRRASALRSIRTTSTCAATSPIEREIFEVATNAHADLMEAAILALRGSRSACHRHRRLGAASARHRTGLDFRRGSLRYKSSFRRRQLAETRHGLAAAGKGSARIRRGSDTLRRVSPVAR